jgi:hypothetical protein
MSIYTQTIQGIYTPLQSAVRNATQTIVGSSLIDPNSLKDVRLQTGINTEASGIIAYLNITVAPGSDTVQLVLEEQDPTSGVWTTVAATTPTALTGMVIMKVKQAIAGVNASQTGIRLQDTLPALWRVRVVHSAGTNFTYSLGIVLYN